jgi:probable rRNA maturation factor
MEVFIDLQNTCEDAASLPSLEKLTLWAQTALTIGGRESDSELTVRMVKAEEIRELNANYRHIDKSTNILSFPFESPAGIDLPLIGDLVICFDVLKREALEQHKTIEEHFAHLIVHGCLHLIGYDHIEPEDAHIMEPLEIQAVMRLGYDNPYKDDEI